MKKIKVSTWLPVFSGFYGTLWEPESDCEMELDHINDERENKGLPPLENDDSIEWDNKSYELEACRGMTSQIEGILKDDGYITSMKMEKIVSPREYNFANDSVDVIVTLTDTNKKKILAYLKEHKAEFQKYLDDRYTSRSGFISRYSNDADQWLNDNPLEHDHMFGAILNFMLLNEDADLEMELYERVRGNGAYLTASNYNQLIGAK